MPTNTNINTPVYPVISWQPKIGGTVQVEDVDTGDILDIDFSDAGWEDAWGFDITGADDLASQFSLHGKLAKTIETWLQTEHPGSTVTPFYIFGAQPGSILVEFELDGTSDDIELLFNNAQTAFYFGFTSAAVTIPEGSSRMTNINSIGYWAPYNLTCFDDRWTTTPKIYTSESMDGTTHKTRRWSTERTYRELTFNFVKPAYMWLYRRKDVAYIDGTNLSILDPHNLYENFIRAARQNNENANSTDFRIYHSNNGGIPHYRRAVLIDQKDLQDPKSKYKDNSGGHQKYFTITCTFLDKGDNGTGAV